jgi:hypothetical protein
LSSPEWRIVELAYECLRVSLLAAPWNIIAEPNSQIVADIHGDLSGSKTMTIHKVFPLIEKVQSDWESHCDEPGFALVKCALDAGLKNMNKWYQKVDDTSIYFISHGMYYISIATCIIDKLLL